jgi:hypothetical protein
MTQRITLTFKTTQPIYHYLHIWFTTILIVCITFSRKHLPPFLSIQFSFLSWNLGEILWKNTFLFLPHSEYMVLVHFYFLSGCQNAWQRPSVQKIFVWFKRYVYLYCKKFFESFRGQAWVLVDHTYTPIFLKAESQDYSSRKAQTNTVWDPIAKTTRWKWTGAVTKWRVLVSGECTMSRSRCGEGEAHSHR